MDPEIGLSPHSESPQGEDLAPSSRWCLGNARRWACGQRSGGHGELTTAWQTLAEVTFELLAFMQNRDAVKNREGDGVCLEHETHEEVAGHRRGEK